MDTILVQLTFNIRFLHGNILLVNLSHKKKFLYSMIMEMENNTFIVKILFYNHILFLEVHTRSL